MVIDSFKGNYSFLSNFEPAEVELDGTKYPTVEAAYQAAKTHDPVWREAIRNARTPAAAKKMGRRAPFRADWEAIKVGIMEYLWEQKFTIPKYKELLLATGDAELIEGNTWGDRQWGVCEGEGLNMLGKLLMKIRDKIRNSEE